MACRKKRNSVANMFGNWKLLILLVMVVSSVLAIGLKTYAYGRNGVEVVFVQPDSPARGVINQGDIITHINNRPINNADEWNNVIQGITGDIKLRINNKDITILINNTFGIDVKNIERTNLQFGLDLQGGTRVLLKPKENVTQDTAYQIISTLETRSNAYGLREIKFQPLIIGDTFLIQIEAAGLQRDIVENLLATQGKFEAKIIKPVDITGDAAIQLGQEKFPVKITGEDIEINNSLISKNKTFRLKNIEFEYVNKTQDRIFLLASVYSGQDIELVSTDPQSSAVAPQSGGYAFYFTVFVSKEGAEKFADVTAGIPSKLDFQTGERYLDTSLLLYLDDEIVSQLSVSEALAGEIFQSPQIQGFRETYEEAFGEKLRLQTILRSGALPTTLETVSVNTISPTLGSEFLITSLYAGILAGTIVFLVILGRYRSLKTVIPLVLISLSEVIIIIGIAAANDSVIWGVAILVNLFIISAVWWKKRESDIFAWIGAIMIPLIGMLSWTIDLPTIGGIIAAIGTGVNDLIIIADEALGGRKKEITEDAKTRIKRAMFTIFGAAAIIIAAMIPLMFLGVGLVRGFAITTIVGVLVGIFITRPVYAKIVEPKTVVS